MKATPRVRKISFIGQIRLSRAEVRYLMRFKEHDLLFKNLLNVTKSPHDRGEGKMQAFRTGLHPYKKESVITP